MPAFWGAGKRQRPWPSRAGLITGSCLRAAPMAALGWQGLGTSTHQLLVCKPCWRCHEQVQKALKRALGWHLLQDQPRSLCSGSSQLQQPPAHSRRSWPLLLPQGVEVEWDAFPCISWVMASSFDIWMGIALPLLKALFCVMFPQLHLVLMYFRKRIGCPLLLLTGRCYWCRLSRGESAVASVVFSTKLCQIHHLLLEKPKHCS